MSFGNFNNRQWVKTIESDSDDSVLALKSFGTAFDLKYVAVSMFIKGANNVTNEQFVVRLHSSANYNRVLATSDTVTLSDVVSGNNYLCRVRTDFDGFPIDVNTTYYFTLKTTNYTRNGNTFYIGLVYDFPFTVQTLGSAETATTTTDYAKKIYVYGEF